MTDRRDLRAPSTGMIFKSNRKSSRFELGCVQEGGCKCNDVVTFSESRWFRTQGGRVDCSRVFHQRIKLGAKPIVELRICWETQVCAGCLCPKREDI